MNINVNGETTTVFTAVNSQLYQTGKDMKLWYFIPDSMTQLGGKKLSLQTNNRDDSQNTIQAEEATHIY